MPSHHPFSSSRSDLLALRMRVLRVRNEIGLIRRDRLIRKCNPDQPRVPAGSPEGGQWGSSGSSGEPGLPAFELPSFTSVDFEPVWSLVGEGWSEDGSVFERTVADTVGNQIRSEYAASRSVGFDERQTVIQPNRPPVSFETRDSLQSIYPVGRTGTSPPGRSGRRTGPNPMRRSSRPFRSATRFRPSSAEERFSSAGNRQITEAMASRLSWASTPAVTS
jgi:hypothetical protein